MPTQRDLFDSVVRHRIALERYSSTQVRDMLRFLVKVEKDLAGRIAALSVDGFDVRQQEAMLNSIRSLYNDAYATLRSKLDGDLQKLAAVEAEFQKKLFNIAAEAANPGATATATFQTLTSSSAYAAAVSRPMQGKLLKDWLDDLAPAHIARVEEQIKIAFTEGESTARAIARVREAAGINRRGAEAIVRTANTHISSAVSNEMYRLNKKVLKGWQFVATLDSRTTMLCAGLDGNIYPVGKGPMPPRHIRCRSTTMPALIGFDPVKRESYNSWLKRQSAEVQDDILGPTRGKLFRKGKFNVERFTDTKGKTLTLEQLGEQ